MKVGDTVWFTLGLGIRKGRLESLGVNNWRVSEGFSEFPLLKDRIHPTWESAKASLVKGLESQAKRHSKVLEDAKALQNPDGPVWSGNHLTYRGAKAHLWTRRNGSKDSGWLTVAGNNINISEDFRSMDSLKRNAVIYFKSLVDYMKGDNDGSR